MSISRRVLAAAALALVGVAAHPVHAKTFRWSSASDIPSLDIHSQNNALGSGVHAAIFETLVYYNSRTFRVEPVLATQRWTDGRDPFETEICQ